MVWLGLLLGLIAFQALRWWPAAEPIKPPIAAAAPAVAPPPRDPWPESARSRRILAGQEGAPAATVAAPRWQVARFASVRVIDGDTFDHGGERIRIANIDTPETHPARCAREAALGARATQRLGELLAAGPFELVPIDRDEDRYGRKLRRVVRGGADIGDMLVSEGLARPYAGGRRSWCG